MTTFIRPVCQCGKPAARKGWTRDGYARYGTLCYTCARIYRAAKTTLTCAMCNETMVDACQLDVDHIDGNHDNNDPANLQVLCANCHRLKTRQERLTAQPAEPTTPAPRPKAMKMELIKTLDRNGRIKRVGGWRMPGS